MNSDPRKRYVMTTARNQIDRNMINVHLEYTDSKGLKYTVLSLTCQIKDLEKAKERVRKHARDRAAGTVG